MPEPPKIWSVSEVNAVIREVIEGSLMPVWVSGEIGNLTVHRSGHVYFTLKDASSQLSAVFFGGAAQFRKLNLREGDKVEVFGKLTVYAAYGKYQINVKLVQPCGIGELQQRFELLKQKLAAEGFFEQSRKKPVPYLPARIGVVTSPSGAAIKDFLKIALGRFPNLQIDIYPAPVQGKGAERKLASGVRFFNRRGGVDVIVLTRGGGSLEDLWPFNEEVLARAIYESRIPVVSAVGHEIDFSISDFVADLRCPTPSGAAEALIPEKRVLEDRIDSMRQHLRSLMNLQCERSRGRLERLLGSKVFRDSGRLLLERRQGIDFLLKDAETALTEALERASSRLERVRQTLQALSPYRVLQRGYSLTMDRDGHPVMSAEGLPSGKEFDVLFADGRISAVSQGKTSENGKKLR